MSRISRQTRAKYPLKVRDGCTEEQCYFCNEEAVSEDFTPAVTASPLDVEHMLEPFVRVKTCNRCWKRIYTVNVAERGHRFNVKRGCMTLRQKEALFGHEDATKAVAESLNRYSISFDPPMIAPLGLNELEDNRFVWNTKTVYREELMTLQGGFALQMVKAPINTVEYFLLSVLMSDDLNGDNLDLYREMLGLPLQSEMIHGTTD